MGITSKRPTIENRPAREPQRLRPAPRATASDTQPATKPVEVKPDVRELHYIGNHWIRKPRGMEEHRIEQARNIARKEREFRLLQYADHVKRLANLRRKQRERSRARDVERQRMVETVRKSREQAVQMKDQRDEARLQVQLLQADLDSARGELNELRSRLRGNNATS